MSLTKYPGALDDNSNMPDRVPFVDLYEAAHMNLVQDAIKAIEAELGTNPSGNLATLKDRLAGVIDEDGKLIPYFPGTVLTVGPDHCHYTSIQAAIDSITDASSSKNYTILVYPGTYAENITMKQYVDILGYSRERTIIEGKLTPAIHTDISNITIQKALPNDYLVDTSGVYSLTFHYVTIYNTDEGGAVKNSGGASGVRFYHCELHTENEDDLDYYPYYNNGVCASFYYTTFQQSSCCPVRFGPNAYGQPHFENCKFLGGGAGIYWEANAGGTPTVLFSFFDNNNHAFQAADQQYCFASGIVANCPFADIYHNVTNLAEHPVESTIYQE